MKKVVILILIFLPIVLMITISIAGKIFTPFVYIEVENVRFVDEFEDPITSIVRLGLGKTIKLNAKVFPEFSNNKNIVFETKDTEIVSVDQTTGTVTALDYGYATVMVITEEKRKTDTVRIQVIDGVLEINLNVEEKTISIGESFQLIATVTPPNAQNAKIIWQSSSPEFMSVDANGLVRALKLTDDNERVVVTARTYDGSAFANVKFTIENNPTLAFILPQDADVFVSATAQVNIFDYLIYNAEIIQDVSQINFSVSSTAFVSLNSSTLTFNAKLKLVEVVARYTSEEKEISLETRGYFIWVE